MNTAELLTEILAIQLYESDIINSRTHASLAWVNASEKTRDVYRNTVFTAMKPEHLYKRSENGRMFEP